ncbi:DUF1398 domain-containing protein [Fulvivirga lutea]|uniref:DUF1398 domain-containing protein n=1 Tax=Fulvivirga lutea TaxID=2810512 RepID=A0A974WDI2_9BACT|nr:DUF1398 family protein [Fulvivirga lutea]QSE96058.1 DUF1398 domain-containing protein [Fulvivirga lutea]
MFTLDQIKAAHSKVKSGADFPNYINDLKQLGVSNYETYVTDGHTDYFGSNNDVVTSPAKYQPLTIAKQSDFEQFKNDLKAHQNGKTDYPTFCADCAKSGITKWVVDIRQMTCTYYDQNRKEALVEKIPSV